MVGRKHSAKSMKAALRAASVGLWTWDLHPERVVFSPEWKRQLGYAPDELADDFAEWERRVHPEDLPELRRCIEECLAARSKHWRLELRMRHRDGTWRWMVVKVFLVMDGEGRPVRMIGSNVDVTLLANTAEELAHAEASLRVTGRRLQTLVDTYPDLLSRFDTQGRFAFVNQQVVRLSGRSESDLLGKRPSELGVSPDPGGDRTIEESLARVVASGGPEELELRLGPASDARICEIRHIPEKDEHGEVVSVLGVARDITERRRAEAELRLRTEELLQAQKMEAIGNLAGGIAHDFNNLLSVIISYSEMLARTMAPEDPRRGDVQEIESASERAAELTRQLLAFARRQVLQPKVVNLDDVVRRVERMLCRLIGEDIELRVVTDEGLRKTKVDPGQVEQIIVNLAVNSRDAMPKGGQLVLSTANVVLDEAFAAEHPGMSPGPHVRLAVADTGCGMNEATRARMFEPFFTTKEVGRGTGLGLATVFGIVRQSGGGIAVETKA